MNRLLSPAFALCLWVPALTALADIAVPKNVLEPATVGEAWNVIGLVTRNIERLLEEKRPDEVTAQVSLCSPALRTLARLIVSPEDKAKLDELTVRAFGFINTTASGSMARDLATVQVGYAGLRGVLDEIAKLYDPAVVRTNIHFCPAHPEFISPDRTPPCATCGLPLVPRRIPYSFIYTTPGEPSMQLTATPDAPLEAGRKVTVKMRLRQRDGKPVLQRDLLVLHTQPIHLLLLDPSLGDQHLVHPVPTETPGEYAFSFTPRKTAPYRLWADLVPAETGVQEYPFCDLPPPGAGDPIPDRNDSFTSTAGGLNFRLSFEDKRGSRPRARETRFLRVTVTDQAGEPVKRLARVLNAFAHLRCFYDDYRSVAHFHPEGGEVLRDDLRGGPALGFKFYPPKAGFLRLYCQVLVDGQMLFAPFNLNVSE